MKKFLLIVIAVMLTACVAGQFRVNLVVQKTSPMLYLNGTGAQLKFNNATLTHSTGLITLAGADFSLGTNNLLGTGSIGATGSRITKLWSTDAEFTNIPTINGTSIAAIYAPIATPTFTTNITTPQLIIGSTAITATGDQLNYLNTATSNIQTQLNAKQATLVSATNIKTVGGISLLGSGDIAVGGSGTVTSVGVTTTNGVSAVVTNPTTAADMVFSLGAITPTSVNGITLSGSSTPALAVSGTTSVSGVNTGDNAVNSLYSGLVSNVTHTGDATGATVLTVGRINGTSLAGLATGILKNTTGSGVPSIALAGTDYVIPSGNVATATRLATPRTINGTAFDGSANISVASNIAAGSLGNFMISNGTTWESSPFALQGVQLTATVTQLNYLSTSTSDIQTQLNAKQATLVSGTNIKTVGGVTLLGSGDIPVVGTGTVTTVGVTTANGISGSVTNPTTTPSITLTLGAIAPTTVNTVAISGSATPTLAVSGTTSVSGVNTGDNAVNSLYSGLVSNATHTGDVTGSTALTIVAGAVTLPKMANMPTSSLIYRRTAGTGIPEVNTLATLKTDLGLSGTNTGDQTDITGNAATATKLLTARTINGVSFDGTANIAVPSNIAPGTSGNVMVSNGSVWTSGTVAGSGSVTSVGVTTANGVSATVANPTSTPNMIFTLGAITPTSVNGVPISGSSTPTLAVSGTTSVSGVNTGDNAVNSLYSGLVSNATHTGEVTGATALTITNGAVTLAKMANMATSSLIYRRTAGAGVPEVNTLATLKTDLGLTGTNSGDQTTITGNAGSATILQTARLINGVSFNGSANINVPSDIAAGTSGNVMTSNGSVWTSAVPVVTLANTATLTNKTLTLPKVNEAVNLTATSTELNSLAGSGVTTTIDYNLVLNTLITAALTDNTPTAAEINAATGLTPSTAGAGYHRTIKDSNGTGLLYRIESDGTSWYYQVMTKAN